MHHYITQFESEISNFYNSNYAIVTDSCTHAIELCLRYTNAANIDLPKHSYLSIPMTAMKLGIQWKWSNNRWHDYYYLENTNIIDSAVYWKENGYVSGSLMCLSFQFKKHLSLGRGGAILTNSVQEYNTLKKMSYDGRSPDLPWEDQDISSIGYHYYMTPETALLGLQKLSDAIRTPPSKKGWGDYPDLSDLTVFQDKTGN